MLGLSGKAGARCNSFKGSILAYVKKNHGDLSKAELARLEKEFDAIHSLRQSVLEIHGHSGGGEAGIGGGDAAEPQLLAESERRDLRNLFCYLASLDQLHKHFPFGEPDNKGFFWKFGGKVEVVDCAFAWSDAFCAAPPVSGRTALADIQFERAAVIFNLACFLSKVAVNLRSRLGGAAPGAAAAAADPTKLAMKLFTHAGLLFQVLLEAAEFEEVRSGASGCLAAGQARGRWGTADLSAPSLLFLHRLMAAQSQACLFEQAAASPRVSLPLRAKLAFGAACRFLQLDALLCVDSPGAALGNAPPAEIPLVATFGGPKACSLSSRPAKSLTELGRWLGRSGFDWLAYVRLQALCLQAAGLFWRAKTMPEARQYGQEIGYLRLAQAQAQEAQQILTKSLTPAGNRNIPAGGLANSPAALQQALHRTVTELVQAISGRLRTAEDDNDQIYFQPPLQPADVPAQETKLGAPASVLPQDAAERQALLFSFPLELAGRERQDIAQLLEELARRPNPFAGLVDPMVRASAASLAAQLQTAVRHRLSQAEEASQIASSQLAGVNLPRALERPQDVPAVQSDDLGSEPQGDGLPDNLWRSVQDIQLKGGVGMLEQLLQRLRSAATDLQRQYDGLEARLEQEQQQDAALMERFGVRWLQRRPSQQITSSLRAELQEIARYLQVAAPTNEEIAQSLAARRADFASRLSLSREQLAATIPPARLDPARRRELLEQERRHPMAQAAAAAAERQAGLARQAEADLRARMLEFDALMAQRHALCEQLRAAAGLEPVVPAELAQQEPSEQKDEAVRQQQQQPSPRIDFVALLLAQEDSSHTERAFEAAMERLEPDFKRLEAVAHQQYPLLEQIIVRKQEWDRLLFGDDKSAAEAPASLLQQEELRAQHQHQLALSGLWDLTKAFESLLANLNEGVGFYSGLRSKYLDPLDQRVTDFLLARQLEKSGLIDELNRSALGQSSPVAASASPPMAPAAPMQPQQPRPQSAALPVAMALPMHHHHHHQQQQQHLQLQPQPQAYNAAAAAGHHGQFQSPPQAAPAMQYGAAAAAPPHYQLPQFAVASPPPFMAMPHAAAPVPSEWACRVCTYANSHGDSNCLMCGTARF